MAAPGRSNVLSGGTAGPAARRVAIRTVLVRVLVLNLAVAVTKLAYGYASGALSILSDGFHSLTDSASNLVALAAVSIASKPPDQDHPYGHRKYETLAAGAIVVFLTLVMSEMTRAAFGRFTSGGVPEITPVSFAVMGVTLGINLAVVRAERQAAARLSSELLLADAMHTRSDVFTSIAVIAALGASWLGFPILDPIAALVIVGFIGRAGYQIAREAARILSDQIVISEEDIQRVVLNVPSVLGCHRIRTRGSPDYVFLDLHVWVDGQTVLEDAHAISHEVKDRLMARYPQIADAVIHIEPPPLA